jgi:DNA-binding MarR family transcriptional regulator
MHTLEKNGITPPLLGMLFFLKLNSTSIEYIRDNIEAYLFEEKDGKKAIDILDELGYVKYIKTGKNDPVVRVRLSEKGETILKELNQKPMHPLSEFTLNYTKKEYERVGAKKEYISGGGKLLNYISEFLYSRPSEYNEGMIKAVISAYCDSFQDSDMKYINKMATLFFKPSNVYTTKFTVEESPICKFVDSNRDLIKYYYKSKR